jgi:hypothetical protein
MGRLLAHLGRRRRLVLSEICHCRRRRCQLGFVLVLSVLFCGIGKLKTK